MKKTGIALIIIGLLLTAFTVFGFSIKKKMVDVHGVEVNISEINQVKWPPYIGGGIILIGGLIHLNIIKKTG